MSNHKEPIDNLPIFIVLASVFGALFVGIVLPICLIIVYLVVHPEIIWNWLDSILTLLNNIIGLIVEGLIKGLKRLFTNEE